MNSIKIKYISKEAERKSKYATPGSAGLDLIMDMRRDSAYESISFFLDPGKSVLLSTGVVIEDMPKDYMAEVRSKSGLALKKGLVVLNSPGTIDSDYTGEIKVIIYNSSSEVQELTDGMYIAQLVFTPFKQASNVIVSTYFRGSGGFGSTYMR